MGILTNTWLLTALFLLAVFMGAGPGLHLINPDLTDPHVQLTTFGLPIIYVWGLFWYVIQFAVIVIAYRFVWSQRDDD